MKCFFKLFKKIYVLLISIYFVVSMVFCHLFLRYASKIPILLYKTKQLFFPLKRFLLAYKSIFSIKRALCHSFLMLIVFFSIIGTFSLSYSFSKYQNIFYTILGAVLSLYMGYAVSKIKDLCDQIDLMPLTVELISTNVLGCLYSIYEKTIIFYPFDDKLCQNKNEIIYVAPITEKSSFDEEKLQKYINFLGRVSEETLYKHFDRENTKCLIKSINDLSFRLDFSYNSLIQYNKFIENKDIFILFYQIFDSIQMLINLGKKNWDFEMEKKIIVLLQFILFRISCCIILAQRENKKYNEYIKYISHSDEVQKCTMLSQSSKIMNIYQKWNFSNLRKISNFSENERDTVLMFLLKFIKKEKSDSNSQ